MTEVEKKTITQEKHPGRVAQGHKLAALLKKRKEEILRSKEQNTEQNIEQSTEQGTEQSTEQSTEQGKEQSTEQGKEQQSNDTYVNGVGILAVLTIGVCVFFAYNTFPKNKKQDNDCSTAQHEQRKAQHEQKQRPKRRRLL